MFLEILKVVENKIKIEERCKNVSILLIVVNFLKKNEITIPRLLQEQQSLFKLWDCEDKFLNVVLIP